MVTIGTCWSVYKAEMQKVVYFTESTIAVIAKHYVSSYKINCQLEITKFGTKFGCLGNACEEHFPKDFHFLRGCNFLRG